MSAAPMSTAHTLTAPRLMALESAPSGPKRYFWRTAAGLLAVLLTVGTAATVLVGIAVAERREALVAATSARLEALARGRAEVLTTWLEGIAALGRRLTRSELVQLFATELALADRDAPLPEALAEQLPYMRQLLDDLARQGELVGTYLVAADGRLLLADSMAPTLTPGQLEEAAGVAKNGLERRFGALAPVAGHLLLDVQLAVPAPQPEAASTAAQGTALVLRVATDERLERLLGGNPLDLPGETARLRLGGGAWIEPLDNGGVRLGPVDMEGSSPSSGPLPAMFQVAASVPGTGWAIEQAVAADVALRPLAEFRRTVTLAAIAGALLLIVSAGGLWWWQASRHQAELLAQYRDLAGRLRQQHDLLHGIMSAVPDLIGLKTATGIYAFANPALSTAMGSTAAAIVGRSDRELFSSETAAVLQRLDHDAAMLGMATRDELEVPLHGRRRHLSIVVVPLADEDAPAVGTVLIARDVTEAVMRRRERERWVEQTIAVLARTIELADPYLCGHSQRMAQLAAELAGELGLDAATVATVRIAATLSQIGKAFVPRELLTKPGRHDEAERQAMRRHVDHAQMVLRDVELGLPVAAALAQMHERLDGTGYPLGLEAAAISLPARVLAVADVFCARTEPRSYRDAAPTEAVIERLEGNPQRYDSTVVAALTAVWARHPSTPSAS
jgi:PAS domain S-box-containing protein